MYWFIGGGILYLVLILTLGIVCIRKRRWVLFVLGIFFPLLWLVGAAIPTRTE